MGSDATRFQEEIDQQMAPRTTVKKGAATSAASKKRYGGFTDEEKGAMQSRVREMKRGAGVDWAGEVQEKIAGFSPADRALAKRVHAIVKDNAPQLEPKLWYGMPAYYRDGKLVCHFQPAQKFKTRYATLGFSDNAKLDEGSVWPVAFALQELSATEEAKVVALLKKALGGA
jgi:uncharacterized protein YdhG (YjbR/CyaY superfamily)